MKRAFFACAALLLAAAVFTGCVSGDGPAASSQENASPTVSYNAYNGIKAEGFENILTKLTADPDFYMEIEPKLMAAGMVVMKVLPVTALDGKEESVKNLETFGFADIKVKQQQQEYIIEFKAADGKEYAQSCKYDASLDYLSSSMKHEDGFETIFFEYIKAADGYIAQYYYIDGQEYSLVTVYADADTAAFGVTPMAGRPGSITANTAPGPDFVKNSETYFLLEGGRLTVFDSGKTTTM